MTPTDLNGRICDFFASREGIAAVYIFGSQAKGTGASSSDVDLAVLFEAERIPNFRDRMAMREDLRVFLGREVDLVAVNESDPILKHQIFKYGHVLLNRDPSLERESFVRSLMEYDDVKRTRAPIERALFRRTYHGG